jgi:cold-inducible RNA-binding protein
MKLYVGNLSFNVNEDELTDLFSQAGTVQSASIVTDRDTGRSRGFGFVEMGSKEEGEAAIAQLNGTDLDGRNLTVNEARPKESRRRWRSWRLRRRRRSRWSWRRTLLTSDYPYPVTLSSKALPARSFQARSAFGLFRRRN